jgi:hypothetical protein
MIKKIPITYEENHDHNSKPVAKVNGIPCMPTEQLLVETVNKLIDYLTDLEEKITNMSFEIEIDDEDLEPNHNTSRGTLPKGWEK